MTALIVIAVAVMLFGIGVQLATLGGRVEEKKWEAKMVAQCNHEPRHDDWHECDAARSLNIATRTETLLRAERALGEWAAKYAEAKPKPGKYFRRREAVLFAECVELGIAPQRDTTSAPPVKP